MIKTKFQHFSHQAMGTFFEVFIAGKDKAYSQSAATEFFKEVDRLEGFFSRFDDRSEISQINRLKPGEMLPIGVETYECLKMSFELMVETGGAFNINFRALREKKGKKAEEKEEQTANREESNPGVDQKNENRLIVSDRSQKNSACCQISWANSEERRKWPSSFPLELAETENGYTAIRLEVLGAHLDLDLGAIGKGYALDKSVSWFADWEVNDFLISAGQSTAYACGQRSWPVAIGGGFDFFKAGKFYLKNRALSGSGHEVKGEHIFDPREKQPISRQLAAWVSHPSAVMADGLSTAFMVMSLEEIETYLERQPQLWTLVISRDKNCYWFNRPDDFEDDI
ncbi:MAG: FAD:protein FMN transferase [Acidobacteriota bacterium]|nr:FAD:protein FMN transferase [Acidobacteriota bacterium]MDY0231889.1 FAD:protein FMN transferase [Candidatus Saccharicenans sp.]